MTTPATPGFRPTHVVPRDGMPAWDAPDPAHPTVPLDPLLPVQVLERRGDWGHVLCSNGWSAWVDGRLLIAVPQDPPAADAPLTRTTDPRPLLTRAEQALARYTAAVEELASGALDGETFHARTRGLRIGVVADGESVWLYDSDHARWVYADGARLTPYAMEDGPRAGASYASDGGLGAEGLRAETPDDAPSLRSGPAHVPTRVVTPGGDGDRDGDR